MKKTTPDQKKSEKPKTVAMFLALPAPMKKSDKKTASKKCGS